MARMMTDDYTLDPWTCAVSLEYPGRCCSPGCQREAVLACLFVGDDEAVECARCLEHAAGATETKPLVWAPQWGPA